METIYRKNIVAIYGMSFFHMFMLIVPVLVPLFQSFGLTLTEIFYIQAVYAGTIVVLEAPSGYLADVFGRRAVLIAGSVINGLGCLWLNFADGFWSLLVFEITLGVASSLLSGADLAMLYDTDQALNQNDDGNPRAIANLGVSKSIAEGSAALLGGWLAMTSFEGLIAVQSVAAWMAFAFAIRLKEPPSTLLSGASSQRPGWRELSDHILKGDRILKLVFLALPLYTLGTVLAAWLIQPLWQSLSLSYGWFGILWCGQSLLVAMGSRFGYQIEARHGPTVALSMIGVLPMLGALGAALIDGMGAAVISFILFFNRGLYQVILVNALNRRVPSRIRATINSLNSLLFRFGFMVTGPIIGFVAQTQGIQLAMAMLAGYSLLVLVLVTLPLITAVSAARQAAVNRDQAEANREVA
jgi:MFS family permease